MHDLVKTWYAWNKQCDNFFFFFCSSNPGWWWHRWRSLRPAAPRSPTWAPFRRMPPPSPTRPRPRCLQVKRREHQDIRVKVFTMQSRLALKDTSLQIIHVYLSSVCIYINKQANTGPNLDRKKIQQLPDHFGPDRPSVVLQQAVQGCIDSAFLQKTVFTLLTQGYGGEKISGVVQRPPSGVAFYWFKSLFPHHHHFTSGCSSEAVQRAAFRLNWDVVSSGSPCFASPATFDGKQHLLSLPVVNSIDYVLRFLKKLCRSLHCENLFSDQPITQHSGGSYHSDGMLIQ